MKIGFMADIHLHVVDNLSNIDPTTGFAVRTLDRLDAIDNALRISHEQGCKIFIFGGDQFEKLNIPERLKDAFYQTIANWVDKFDEIIIFPGNHDGATFTHNFMSEKTLLKSLNTASGIKIIDEMTILEYPDYDIFIIPWIADHSQIETFILNNHIKSNKNLLFGHLEISGSLASTEYTLTSGLSPALFKKFRQVFLGHYHRHQKISNNIMYVGSPIVKDLSEMGIEKGFIIYDYDLNLTTFYQLETRQVFRLTLHDENIEEIDDFLSGDSIKEGDIIEVVIKGNKNWVNEAYPVIKEIVNSKKPLKSIIKRIIDTDSNIEDSEIQDIVNKHTRIEKIKQIALGDPKEEIEYGLAIFDEASNKFLDIEL